MMKQPLLTASDMKAEPMKLPGPAGPASHGDTRVSKLPILLAGTSALVLLAGCGGHVDPPPVPDLAPVGEGLKVVAYAVVAAAVIVVLGKLLP